ncbi:hypothetical protein Tco_1419392 [Tanacetum coccineum]
MEKTYSLLQAEETTTEGKPVTFMDSSMGDKTQKGRSWEGSEKKNRDKRDRLNPYNEPNLEILQSLTKSQREILVTEKVGKTFMKPPKMVSKPRDTSKYCEFHQDYGHDTKAYNQLREWQSLAVKAESVVEGKEEPILMIGGSVHGPYPHKHIGLQKASRKKFARWRSPLGKISLRITVGEASHHRSDQITFLFKEKLIKLLRDNVDVFTWKYSDMTGIPRTLKIGDEIFVTEHKLNEDKKITSVQQKKRGMAPDRSATTLKEV